jgi:hypothetical protein
MTLGRHIAAVGLSAVLAAMLTGCVSILGGMIGADLMDDEAQEHLRYYVKTEDLSPGVRTAMKERRIVNGMDTTEVSLVMDAKGMWMDTPEKSRNDTGRVWVYQQRGAPPNQYVVQFSDSIVVSHSLPLDERPANRQ